jgi:hypothetical protein
MAFDLQAGATMSIPFSPSLTEAQGDALHEAAPELEGMTPTPLQAHFRQCSLAGGLAHRLHYSAEALVAFVAPRMVSLLVVAGLLALAVTLSFGAP